MKTPKAADHAPSQEFPVRSRACAWAAGQRDELAHLRPFEAIARGIYMRSAERANSNLTLFAQLTEALFPTPPAPPASLPRLHEGAQLPPLEAKRLVALGSRLMAVERSFAAAEAGDLAQLGRAYKLLHGCFKQHMALQQQLRATGRTYSNYIDGRPPTILEPIDEE